MLFPKPILESHTQPPIAVTWEKVDKGWLELSFGWSHCGQGKWFWKELSFKLHWLLVLLVSVG